MYFSGSFKSYLQLQTQPYTSTNGPCSTSFHKCNVGNFKSQMNFRRISNTKYGLKTYKNEDNSAKTTFWRGIFKFYFYSDIGEYRQNVLRFLGLFLRWFSIIFAFYRCVERFKNFTNFCIFSNGKWSLSIIIQRIRIVCQWDQEFNNFCMT